MTRICKKCGLYKEKYPKQGSTCSDCVKAYMQTYRKNNAERISELKRIWKQNNKAHTNEKDRLYAIAYPERKAEARKKWVQNNPEKDRLAKRKYAIANTEKHKEANYRWRMNNTEKARAAYARRRAAKKNATPSWVDSEERFLIEEAYHLAKIREQMTGIKWHVDHIIPLQHDLVCGLHTIHNIQVILAKCNQLKSNTFKVI